jgi:hypothetical protein
VEEPALKDHEARTTEGADKALRRSAQTQEREVRVKLYEPTLGT